MSKMEVGDWDIDQNPISLGPDFALSAESRINKIVVYTGIDDIASIPLKNVFMSIKRSHYADIKNVVHSFMKPG